MELSLGKKPSALIPAVMSLFAVFLFVIQLTIHGGRPVPAQGALAFAYLLLVLAQLPVIARFLVRWFRRAPRQGMPIVLSQGLALATALVPVHMMGW